MNWKKYYELTPPPSFMDAPGTEQFLGGGGTPKSGALGFTGTITNLSLGAKGSAYSAYAGDPTDAYFTVRLRDSVGTLKNSIEVLRVTANGADLDVPFGPGPFQKVVSWAALPTDTIEVECALSIGLDGGGGIYHNGPDEYLDVTYTSSDTPQPIIATS